MCHLYNPKLGLHVVGEVKGSYIKSLLFETFSFKVGPKKKVNLEWVNEKLCVTIATLNWIFRSSKIK